MASSRTPILGGNWKMNTDRVGAAKLAREIAEWRQSRGGASKAEAAIFPPFVYLGEVRKALDETARDKGNTGWGGGVVLGAQDVYHQPNGAFTGEISTAMLRDVGVSIVLTGHSERRHVLNESEELVNKKTLAVLNAGLTCILCVGEKLEERKAGQTDAVNERQIRSGLAGVTREQMARVVIAYEPVWAIGTGQNATPSDAQNAHARIRAVLSSMYSAEVARATRIQYGGSMKGSNAGELLAQPDVDGGLIGGASLIAEEFCKIIAAAESK